MNRRTKTRSYRGHKVELESEPATKGQWRARATIVIGDGKASKQIPIFGRHRTTFGSQIEADAYALELAKIWIDGRLWGANGRG